MDNIAIVLLAAGKSSRMGSPKQLLDFHGQPLVRHAALAALGSQCRPVIIVCGAFEEMVRAALSDLPVTIAPNPLWEKGIGTSIQAGLSALPETASAAILTLGDLPLLTAATYDHLASLHRGTGKPIVAAEYAETVGVPVLFARSAFGDLMRLQPDQGCKGIILRNSAEAIRMACPEAEVDVDTPVDHTSLLAREN